MNSDRPKIISNLQSMFRRQVKILRYTYNFGSNGRLNVTFRLGVTTRRLNSVLDGIHDRKLAIYFAGSRTNYAHQHAQVRVFRRSR